MGRTFFAWAKEKCYVKENPFETIKTKREGEKRRILIDKPTRDRIRAYLMEKNPEYLYVCQLVFTSLIRPKEIRLIQVKHIFLDEKCIMIPNENAKTHNLRYAAMSKELHAYLSEIKINRYPEKYYLFGEDLRPSANPCGTARFRQIWERVRKDLKLPQEMQLYSFRDTGINNLLKSGVDALTVMQHADHHDLAMTTRYANHADSGLIQKIYDHAPEF